MWWVLHLSCCFRGVITTTTKVAIADATTTFTFTISCISTVARGLRACPVDPLAAVIAGVGGNVAHFHVALGAYLDGGCLDTR